MTTPTGTARFPALDPEPPPLSRRSRLLRLTTGALALTLLIGGLRWAWVTATASSPSAVQSARILAYSASSATLSITSVAHGTTTSYPSIGPVDGGLLAAPDGQTLISSSGRTVILKSGRPVSTNTTYFAALSNAAVVTDLADDGRYLVASAQGTVGSVSLVSTGSAVAHPLGEGDAVAGDPIRPALYVAVPGGDALPTGGGFAVSPDRSIEHRGIGVKHQRGHDSDGRHRSAALADSGAHHPRSGSRSDRCVGGGGRSAVHAPAIARPRRRRPTRRCRPRRPASPSTARTAGWSASVRRLRPRRRPGHLTAAPCSYDSAPGPGGGLDATDRREHRHHAAGWHRRSRPLRLVARPGARHVCRHHGRAAGGHRVVVPARPPSTHGHVVSAQQRAGAVGEPMRSLPTLVRGLWFRRGSSAAIVLLASLSCGAAALGPDLRQRSAHARYCATRLRRQRRSRAASR